MSVALTRIASMRRGLRCWLHGHAWRLQMAPGRLSLVCMDCHKTTAGWTLTGDPLPRKASIDR